MTPPLYKTISQLGKTVVKAAVEILLSINDQRVTGHF
jgi:hypothetical protein